MAGWNPWHGCHKLSEGCQNCYIYRSDGKRDKPSSVVARNATFDAPVRRNKKGEFSMKGGQTVWTCFSSDFFVPDADPWRDQAWDMIRERSDLHFFMITKRIDRLAVCTPHDWGDGWENVTICCTMENQRMVDYRFPIYAAAPVKHKILICEPLLSAIQLPSLAGAGIEQVVAGGESGWNARPCRYEWVLGIRDQCREQGVSFRFRQTGNNFIKEGRSYKIARKYQYSQARRAGIDLN